MAHLWQHHHGRPSRTGYHNAEWARMMLAVGLVQSDTGQSGGRQSGQQMTHYIAPGGPFAVACAALLEDGFTLPYVELWSDGEAAKRRKKSASKTRYTCPGCGANAWARPALDLICGACSERMEAAGEADGKDS